jgi:hypothetical protein
LRYIQFVNLSTNIIVNNNCKKRGQTKGKPKLLISTVLWASCVTILAQSSRAHWIKIGFVNYTFFPCFLIHEFKLFELVEQSKINTKFSNVQTLFFFIHISIKSPKFSAMKYKIELKQNSDGADTRSLEPIKAGWIKPNHRVI